MARQLGVIDVTPGQLAAVVRVLYEIEDEDEKLEAIAAMEPEQLEAVLAEYNWDDGVLVPTAIAQHPKCDRALALHLFWLGDALTWYTRESDPRSAEWDAFCRLITEGLLAERYPIGELSYDPGLGRVQLYQYRKAGIPELFLTPVTGLQDDNDAS